MDLAHEICLVGGNDQALVYDLTALIKPTLGCWQISKVKCLARKKKPRIKPRKN